MKIKATSLLNILGCLAIGILLLTACGEPGPLSQEQLDNINCHPGDLPPNQTYNPVEGRQPSVEVFLETQPTLVSVLAWNDIASTRQTISCAIYVFADVASAQNGFELACHTLLPPFRFPDFADLTCQSGDQEVQLIFQKDVYLVWIWADYKGQGIQEVADRLLERIENQ